MPPPPKFTRISIERQNNRFQRGSRTTKVTTVMTDFGSLSFCMDPKHPPTTGTRCPTAKVETNLERKIRKRTPGRHKAVVAGSACEVADASADAAAVFTANFAGVAAVKVAVVEAAELEETIAAAPTAATLVLISSFFL